MNVRANQKKEQNMNKEVKKITHSGELKIGDMMVSCYVTEDGTRLLSSAQTSQLLRISDGATASASKSPKIINFLSSDSLQPFVSKALGLAPLGNIFAPIKAKKITNNNAITINGYLPESFTAICKMMIEAKNAGALVTPKQHMVAEQCESIRDALAWGVGIVALIDEATGYQNSREKDHLQRLFNHYLAPECRPWVKTFPDEFFTQVMRLTGCKYDPKTNQLKPLSVAKFIRDFICGSFPMGILDEIDKRNPVIGKTPNGSYKRRSKHHQWMSEELGKNELMARIRLATAIMKGHQTLESFKRHWAQIIAPEQLVLVQQSFMQR